MIVNSKAKNNTHPTPYGDALDKRDYSGKYQFHQ